MKNLKKSYSYVQSNIFNQLPKSNEINDNSFSKKDLMEKFHKNNALIAIRIRPLNSEEKEDADYKTIKVISNNSLLISAPLEYSFEKMDKINYMKIIREKQSLYKYDFIFDEKASQEKVYESTSYHLIPYILEGYNATIFAYGATGTGKTYTMLGEGDNIGIMIRTIKDLFFFINYNNDNSKDIKYIIKLSYIEIYNEVIKDLLNNNQIIELISDPKKGLILKNTFNKIISNEDEAFNLIMEGNKNRTENTTENNKKSSRSHAILNIYIDFEDEEIKSTHKISFGKFMLLDLAGSEKTSFEFNAKNKELGSINKSLLALNKCISLLVVNNKSFIPWRESNLTRLLQNSLSGNSKTVIIATLSQALCCYDESIFTLNFASRAKKLKLNMKKNIISQKDIFERIMYKKYIQELKKEIFEVKNDIKEQDLLIESIKNKSGINLDVSKNEEIKQYNSENRNDNVKREKPKNKYEKLYKDMLKHFQSEIKLKKNIIEKEKLIEELKNSVEAKKYEILHSDINNLPPLQKQLKEKKEEITEKNDKLLNVYIKQNELINKRKDFQRAISFLSKQNDSPNYHKIFNIYKYNINLLNKMTIEHKNYMNMQESKRRDKKIGNLMDQLDIRDKYIIGAYKQFEKNNIEFNYQNPNLIKSGDIDTILLKPSSIQIKGFRDSFKNFFKNKKISLHKLNKSYNEENDTSNINDKNSEKKIFLKRINTNKSQSNKNRSFNDLMNNSIFNHELRRNLSELSSIFRKRKNGLNINDFIRKKNIQKFRNDNNIFINFNNLRQMSFGPDTKKFNLKEFSSPTSVSVSERMNKNKRINFEQRKNNDYNNLKNRSMIFNFEAEIQKKIKTILRKNYIARYNNSPFLKIFNE